MMPVCTCSRHMNSYRRTVLCNASHKLTLLSFRSMCWNTVVAHSAFTTRGVCPSWPSVRSTLGRHSGQDLRAIAVRCVIRNASAKRRRKKPQDSAPGASDASVDTEHDGAPGNMNGQGYVIEDVAALLVALYDKAPDVVISMEEQPPISRPAAREPAPPYLEGTESVRAPRARVQSSRVALVGGRMRKGPKPLGASVSLEDGVISFYESNGKCVA